MVAAIGLLFVLSGCTAVTQPINGVPSNRLPPQFFETPKNEQIPIDISLLAREKPRQYISGAGRRAGNHGGQHSTCLRGGRSA